MTPSPSTPRALRSVALALLSAAAVLPACSGSTSSDASTGAATSPDGGPRSSSAGHDGGAARTGDAGSGTADAGAADGTSDGGAESGTGDGGASVVAPTGTPLALHGRLHVCGTHLCDAAGATVQLRGISTHGLQWFGWNQRCLEASSLDSMAVDWKADVVRLAMYVQEGGYASDPARFDAMIDTLVDETAKRGLYAIVDWHILNPGDPTANQALAKTFFARVAAKHGGKPHVLFEIANEPNGSAVGWSTIRPYAETILGVVRGGGAPDTVVIVGTPDWSSFGKSGGHSPDDVVAGPPVDPATKAPFANVMYTFHFYAASHRDDYRAVVRTYAAKVPIFVTEWGTPSASGDGAIDEASTAAWLQLLAADGIGWASWNWSDDGTTGALLAKGACDPGKATWTGAALQRSGQIVFDAMRNR